jgi:hypothetical protein
MSLRIMNTFGYYKSVQYLSSVSFNVKACRISLYYSLCSALTFIVTPSEKTSLGLLEPKDEGTTIFRNVGNY